jgi:CheY-like chemotaxis protein
VAEKQSVLIICRTAAGQMSLGVLLNRIWFSPILVRTVEEGIRFVQKTRFSIILFDGDIPQAELQASFNLLRNDSSLARLPLVVFRTDDNTETNESMLNRGCTAVLTKPLDPTILYGLLQRLSGQPRTTPRVSVRIPVEIAAIQEGMPKKNLTCINISEGGGVSANPVSVARRDHHPY